MIFNKTRNAQGNEGCLTLLPTTWFVSGVLPPFWSLVLCPVLRSLSCYSTSLFTLCISFQAVCSPPWYHFSGNDSCASPHPAEPEKQHLPDIFPPFCLNFKATPGNKLLGKLPWRQPWGCILQADGNVLRNRLPLAQGIPVFRAGTVCFLFMFREKPKAWSQRRAVPGHLLLVI